MALLKRRPGRVPGLLASFLHVDAAADAIRAMRALGIRDLTVYTPAPNHDIEHRSGSGGVFGAHGQAGGSLRSAVQRRPDRHLRAGALRSGRAGGAAAPFCWCGGGTP